MRIDLNYYLNPLSSDIFLVFNNRATIFYLGHFHQLNFMGIINNLHSYKF